MRARLAFRLSALALGALLLAPCGGDSTGGGNNNQPTSGWLSLRLTTPNTDDGGVFITVTGPDIDSVRTSHTFLVTRRQSESSVRVVIGGFLSAGQIGQILVPDTRQAAQYSVSIQEVAARAIWQQRPVTGYSVSVVAPTQ